MKNQKFDHSKQDWRQPKYLAKSKNFSGSGRNSGRIKLPDGWLRKFLGFFIPVAIFLFLVGAVFSVIMVAWVSKDLPNPNGVINRAITVSSKIYDRDGKTVLYDLHGDVKRNLITLNEIPDHAVKATLAAEDRDFYNHKGFSITGIIRSAIKDILTGSRVGGSTLTQQFVKNAILTNEKTLTRKVKELILSYQIEQKFSKEEILQMYFNEIPYGSVIYGIEAASQTYFGKAAKELTISEGALLAAILNRPTYYSPYGNNRDQLLIRQRYIIDSMVKLNYISKEQAEQAKQEKIAFKPMTQSIKAPHFVMYVKEILTEKYGEDFVNQEGLKIYTTLDLEKQNFAEEAVSSTVKTLGPKYNFTNASLVSIDPKTGQILAMVGSANYFDEKIDGQVNVAISNRQPGSSFKPIVYTASFIEGFTPNTILYDVVTNFDTSGSQKYEPHNYDLKERGPVTIRKALAGSLNIPAVKALYLTGVNNVLDLADKLGYSTLKDRDRFGLSIVLGGGEVKLLEHANAYATLAQDGVRHELAAIYKIEDKNGKVIYEFKDKTTDVIDPEIARQTTDILSDDSARAYIFGSGSKLTLPDRQVAAKTGTTNDYHDAWTMGYTPNLVTGVWVGNSNNKEMKRGADGSIVAAPIWNQYMKNALANMPKESFTKPKPVLTGKNVLDGIVDFGSAVKVDTMSGKLATEYTPESTIKEVTNNKPHSILHYVNKEDPRGAAPRNPQEDPQYVVWEAAVARWAEANNQGGEQVDNIPTEYDDIHLAADQPSLIIITPLPEQKINEKSLTVEITASAKRGVKKVEYYIDNVLVQTRTDASEATIDLSSFTAGSHQLIVKVKDDLDNTAMASVNLVFGSTLTLKKETTVLATSTKKMVNKK